MKTESGLSIISFCILCMHLYYALLDFVYSFPEYIFRYFSSNIRYCVVLGVLRTIRRQKLEKIILKNSFQRLILK